MATDSLELEDIQELKHVSPTKKRKRTKRTVQANNSNGTIENGSDSQIDSIPSRFSKSSNGTNHRDSPVDTSITSQPSDRNTYDFDQANNHLNLKEKTSAESPKFQRYELSTVTDDDDEDLREQRERVHPTDYINSDQRTTSAMGQSYTSGDHDAVEIHEFSLGDLDAYLDLYFTTLDNRLRHFIGEADQLEQFRRSFKDRITSDRNAREYQNVLLGKINGEVVAAVTLVFPGEPTTISNENILPQVNSCFASIRRWLLRNANYKPTNMEECYIEMIGVKKPFQNHGIGAAMLECIEHFARQAGAHILTIHVNSDRLQGYFQRFGFVLDHTDNSAIWKWAVERQNTHKMLKLISNDDETRDHQTDNNSGFINESMTGSELG